MLLTNEEAGYCVAVLCVILLAVDLVTAVLCMLLSGHLCTSVDFDTGWLFYINPSSGWFHLICAHTCVNTKNQYGLRSHSILQVLVLRVRTESGEQAFRYAAASSWNNVQKDVKLSELISVGFKSVVHNCITCISY